MKNIKLIISAFFCFFLTIDSVAQSKLIFNMESVDSLLSWMKKGCNKKCIIALSEQPAMQIMEQLLMSNERKTSDFKTALEIFNPNDSISGNIYMLNEAYKSRFDIAALAENLKKSNFAKRVYKRVSSFFPKDYSAIRNYEVFYTAVGWKWGDAMSFNYTFNKGKYEVSDTGTPAIIFNLTLVCKLYGKTLCVRQACLENVMSHELFHAIFSDYIQKKWKPWNNEDVDENTLYLMLNEGMAHYIADGDLLRRKYDKDNNLRQKEKLAFASLADHVKIIFNENEKDSIRKDVLNAGLYGKYWSKYICITGLFMAYHIERYYGREELQKCIEKGPLYFVRKYKSLQRTNGDLPELPYELANYVKSHNVN